MASTHEAMIALHAEEHELIRAIDWHSAEDYVLHLMHEAAYFQAAAWVRGKRVLDVGCNTGYGTAILAKSAQEVVGVDVSLKAIREASKRYHAPNLVFRTVDGADLPFSGAYFDIVTSFQVIEHVVDHDLYVPVIKRITKPAGAVVFTTPNGVMRLDPGMPPWNRFHVREFSAHELTSLLSRYYTYVVVYGLFADAPLYEVECRRVERARVAARARARAGTLRTLAKAVIPNMVVRAYEYLLHPSHDHAPALRDYPTEYAGSSFFYRRTDLDHALDLMAVCTDDASLYRSMNRHTR